MSLSVVALVVTALEARTAEASEVRVTSRTIGEAYMVRVPGPAGALLGRRRLVQYVNLGAYALLPPKEPDEVVRAPEDGQLQVVSSLRLRHDFGTFTRRAQGDAERLLEALDGRQIDLLYGYLEGQRLGGWIDFRLGRQFDMSGLDFYAFDGGWVRAATPAHIAVEAFGGLSVDGSAVFGFPTFELDGTQGTPRDDARSMTVGAAFALHDVKFMDARFAYRRVWTPAGINEDIVAADGTEGLATAVDQEFVSGSVALRLLDGRVAPFGAGRYNIGTNRFDDLTAGVHWKITDIHSVRALYLRTIPTFDLDSIFNVFAIEPFEDLRLIYQVRPSEHWTLEGRFQGRFFRATDTLTLRDAPDEPVAFGGGGGAAAAYRRRRFAMRIDGYGLSGHGGLRVGGSVDTRTHVWYDRVAIDGRAFFVYYDDELYEDRQGYSLAIQAGTNVRLAHGVYLNVIAEEVFTPFLDHSLRVLGVLSVDWAFRAGTR